jgi:hypothetical protein
MKNQQLMLTLFLVLGAVLVAGLIGIQGIEEVDADKGNAYCGDGGCFETKKECKESSDGKCGKSTQYIP